MKTEKTLSEKLKALFEIEYLDSMADVQGDVHVLFKEAVENLKDEIRVINGSNEANKDYDINCGWTLEEIDKIFGEFK